MKQLIKKGAAFAFGFRCESGVHIFLSVNVVEALKFCSTIYHE